MGRNCRNGRSDFLRGVSRRRFLAGSACAAALATSGMRLDGAERRQSRPTVASAHGADAAANTRAAVEAVGGIDAFVGSGDVVAILPNAQGMHPGTSTNPHVVNTVVRMCLDAGAREVRWLTWMFGWFLDRSDIAALMRDCDATLVTADVEDPAQWRTLEVPRGEVLGQVRVFDALWDSDVFINMPILKDHGGSRYTGALKNYMGTSHPEDDRDMHRTGSLWKCVADLNTVTRPADLIVADMMTALKTNGPFGPGDIVRPLRVIAGTDPVAIDTYGSQFLGLVAADVEMISHAHTLGLGQIDMALVNPAEIEVG